MSHGMVRVGLAFAIGLAVLPVRAQEPASPSLAALARQALGGEANLARVTSFTIKGRSRLLRSTAQGRWQEFSIAAEFPDKFVRSGDFGGYLPSPVTAQPAAGSYLTSAGDFRLGFNGAHVIADGLFNGEDYRDLDGRWRPFVYPQDELDAKYLSRARAQALPWLLGMFAQTAPFLRAQLEPATGPASATTLIVNGDDLSRPMTLAFDPTTHLPATFDLWSYEDYRDVNGVKIPFRLRNASATQEITAIHLNVKIDAKRFRLSGR